MFFFLNYYENQFDDGWYYLNNSNESIGPHTIEVLSYLYNQQKSDVNNTTLICKTGGENSISHWTELQEIEILKMICIEKVS